MSSTGNSGDIAEYNQRQLQTLNRAISLSQGQFSLILVRCNYHELRQKMLTSLSVSSRLTLLEINLYPTTKNLYGTLLTQWEEFREIYEKDPSVMIILGLEKVVTIDEILTSINQVRDEFRKNFSCPVIIWITDEITIKLRRLAPDFKSWAAVTIKFKYSPKELNNFLKEKADHLFAFLSTELINQNKLFPWNKIYSSYLSPNKSPETSFSGHQESGQKLLEETLLTQRKELEQAFQELLEQGYELEPSLTASLHFILGRDSYSNDQIERALEHYQQSLIIWKNELKKMQQESVKNSDFDREEILPDSAQNLFLIHSHSSQYFISLERQGIVLFYIALCYQLKAARDPTKIPQEWEDARGYLTRARVCFIQANRPDLVAVVIAYLGEVLQHLNAWQELQNLAESSLELHLSYGTLNQLAKDYGFLAEVALQENQWKRAEKLTKLALDILEEREESCPNYSPDKSLYLWLLGRSLRSQKRYEESINSLKLALSILAPNYDPRLCINILEELRLLYFDKGEYVQAFRVKKKQRSIEHQYGFRAFIGASQLQPAQTVLNLTQNSLENQDKIPEEISACSRLNDIKNLIQRISEDHQKLMIIHGHSGVGKSSLVNAGLVPSLQNFTLGGRKTLPIVLRTYIHWMSDLEISLKNAQSREEKTRLKEVFDYSLPLTFFSEFSKNHGIIDLFKRHINQGFFTLLIFDQFEEFFLGVNTLEQRIIFYDFLKICLDLPFIKIILCLREDYLHYLLEWDQLPYFDAINNNILDRKNRYSLQDFSMKDARSVIYSLTKRTHLALEDELIDALVKDLADSQAKIRPIELQVVGAQLQEEGMRTLAEYQQLGISPKAELVKRSLDQVIADCGIENKDAAWKILFALTDEKGIRPIKTKHELSTLIYPTLIHQDILTFSGIFNPHNRENYLTNLEKICSHKLDLILEILTGHGLIFIQQNTPENHYQLVHDYLVHPIRKRFSIEARLHQAEVDKTNSEVELYRTNKILKSLLITSIFCLFLLGSSTLAALNFWQGAVAQKKLAMNQQKRAEIHKLTASSEALFSGNHELDSLMASLRAAQEWKSIKKNSEMPLNQRNETEILISSSLQKAVYGVREKNRLEGHREVVWGVIFHPTGHLIASASIDKTIRFWNRQGLLLKTLKGHTSTISALSFSPDGQLLASASYDQTIRLWDTSGKTLQILRGHQGNINSVSFSKQGQLIASGGEDKTVKIWNRDGQLLTTLPQPTSVNWVSFSPEDDLLAVGTDQGLVTLWKPDHFNHWILVKTLVHSLHQKFQKVYHVNFSPQGDIIATAGEDRKIKLWTKNGELLDTLVGHDRWVFSVSFSPDGKYLVSGGGDRQIALWKLPIKSPSDPSLIHRFLINKTRLIKKFSGHNDQITQVSFSPDYKIFASSSYDKIIKFWQVEERPLKFLKGHHDQVKSVQFSPDGRWLASASNDKTIKLWNTSGKLLKTLSDHQAKVVSLSFSKEGNFLASASEDHTVKIWFLLPLFHGGINVPIYPLTLRGHTQGVISVSFSPQGNILASAGKDKTIKIWTTDGRLLLSIKAHDQWINCVRFSPDGKFLISGSDDGTFKLWQFNNIFGVYHAILLKTVQAHDNLLLDLSFSPNGELIASASYDNTIKLWSREGRLIKTLLEGGSDSITSISFSPDSQLIASASYDNTIKLWSRTGSLLKTLPGHQDGVLSVHFSPDGKLLASGGKDSRIILWNFDLDDLIKRGCSWVRDYLTTNINLNESDRHLCDNGQLIRDN